MTNIVQDIVLPVVETAVEKVIEDQSDAAVEVLIAKLVEICPVDAIDAIIISFKPKAKEVVKAELLKLAEQISKA